MKRTTSFLALSLLLVLLFTACTATPPQGVPAGTDEASGTETDAVTLYPERLDAIDAAVIPGALDGTEENGFILSELSVSEDKRLYVIPTLDAAPAEDDWAAVRALKLWTYKWRDNGYEPDVYAQLVFVPEDGFYLKMTCFETDPYYAATEYLGSVWNDSCMEFFADWFTTGSYTNMEINAYGASYQGYGVSMEDRIKLPAPLGEVKAEILSDRWTVNVRIPLAGLGEVTGGDVSLFTSGYLFTGNFYKCGSKTAYPHYGMWNTVVNENANFHLSQYFGYLYIA